MLCSGSEERGRYDGDSIGAEPFLEPMQVADIVVGDGSGRFDFEGDDSAVVSFDDQVDFLLAAAASQISDAGLVRLCVGAHGERDEGLEQGAVPRDRRALCRVVEQRVDSDTQQPGC